VSGNGTSLARSRDHVIACLIGKCDADAPIEATATIPLLSHRRFTLIAAKMSRKRKVNMHVFLAAVTTLKVDFTSDTGAQAEELNDARAKLDLAQKKYDELHDPKGPWKSLASEIKRGISEVRRARNLLDHAYNRGVTEANSESSGPYFAASLTFVSELVDDKTQQILSLQAEVKQRDDNIEAITAIANEAQRKHERCDDNLRVVQTDLETFKQDHANCSITQSETIRKLQRQVEVMANHGDWNGRISSHGTAGKAYEGRPKIATGAYEGRPNIPTGAYEGRPNIVRGLDEQLDSSNIQRLGSRKRAAPVRPVHNESTHGVLPSQDDSMASPARKKRAVRKTENSSERGKVLDVVRRSSRVPTPRTLTALPVSVLLPLADLPSTQRRRIAHITVPLQQQNHVIWQDPSKMDPILAEKLERAFYSTINAEDRVKFWSRYPADHTDCALTFVIAKGASASIFANPFRACNYCSKMKRPCAKLLMIDGVEVLGFHPLDMAARTTNMVSDLGYYVKT
jgi:hypothetical protein